MAFVRGDDDPYGLNTNPYDLPRTPSQYGQSRAGSTTTTATDRLSDPVGSWAYDPSGDPVSPSIPKNYRVQVGSQWNARGMPFRPMTPDQYMYEQPVYAKPIYSYNDVKAMWGKGPSQVADRQRILIELGYLDGVNSLGYWDMKSEKALYAAMLDANKNAVSLEDLYAYAKRTGQTASQRNANGGGSGAQARTITSKSYNITSEAGAQQILRQALARELGRAPTQDEVRAFTGALNTKERANPTVTVTNISASGSSQTSTTTAANVEPGAEAESWSQTASPEERKMYQNSQYMGVIADMLGL